MMELTLPEIKEYGFERLLFKSIFGGKYWEMELSEIPIPPYILFYLQYAVFQLPDKKRDIILLRFGEKKTLRKVAEKYDVTPERIRQTENHIIREIRRNFYGWTGSASQCDYEEVLAEKASESYQLGFSDGYELIYNEERLIRPALPKSSLHIDTLDLPVRVRRAFIRSGIHSLYEAAQLTYEQLAKIRNVGKNTIKTIKEILSVHGFDVSHLDPSHPDMAPNNWVANESKVTRPASYVCMPLRVRVPEGRPDWKLIKCPECEAECWRGPLVETAEKKGSVALCTACALSKSKE